MRSATPSSPRRLRSRAGTSLIQLVIVMSIASVLMSLTGIALHRLFRQEVALVEAVSDTMAWHRLSHEFRHYAHHARSATSDEPSSELRFELPDGAVLWQVVGSELHRRRVQINSDERLPAEVYRFTDSDIRFAADAISEDATLDGQVVTVEVTRHEGVPGKAFPVRLQAAVGLNHRVAAASTQAQPSSSE